MAPCRYNLRSRKRPHAATARGGKGEKVETIQGKKKAKAPKGRSVGVPSGRIKQQKKKRRKTTRSDLGEDGKAGSKEVCEGKKWASRIFGGTLRRNRTISFSGCTQWESFMVSSSKDLEEIKRKLTRIPSYSGGTYVLSIALHE